MRNLSLYLCLLILCCAIPATAQEKETATDSVTSSIPKSELVDTVYVPQTAIEQLGDTPTVYVMPLGQQIFENKYFQMTYIGVPLVVAGIATQGCTSQHFKDLRDAYVPTFDYSYDDYLQYAPAAAMLIMKACGVKGRSSWGRMIVSDVFSVALMAGIVNGLKYSVGTMRPDNSTRNSFPSGHTATAFMAAHMLHKEYGNVSPWISVGGYTVAAVVGVSRQLNNRHWISDVLAGAGIGILSVEFGYFFADLIFKEKGLYNIDKPDFTIPDKPSHLGLTMGLTLPLAPIEIGNGQQLISTTGSRMGIDGAWYINRYVGIGGSAAVASMPTTLASDTERRLSIDAATVALGAYGSIPMGESSRFRANLKALLGCNFIDNSALLPEVMTLDKAGFYYEIGASLSVVARRHFGVSVFCDYGGHCFSATHTPSSQYGITREGRYNYMLHTTTIGATTSILF